jgi:hypothetical protein
MEKLEDQFLDMSARLAGIVWRRVGKPCPDLRLPIL